MRILGIDPGSRLTGYACLAGVAGRRVRVESVDSVELIEGGVIRLDPKKPLAARLVELEADLASIIERLAPAALAVEKLYAHYKHPTTAIIMGHARGIILAAASRAGLTIFELGATEVKKSLTGHGHASKPQMQRAVQTQLNLPAPPRPPDVADAIAIALCALRRGESLLAVARPQPRRA